MYMDETAHAGVPDNASVNEQSTEEMKAEPPLQAKATTTKHPRRKASAKWDKTQLSHEEYLHNLQGMHCDEVNFFLDQYAQITEAIATAQNHRCTSTCLLSRSSLIGLTSR